MIRRTHLLKCFPLFFKSFGRRLGSCRHADVDDAADVWVWPLLDRFLSKVDGPAVPKDDRPCWALNRFLFTSMFKCVKIVLFLCLDQIPVGSRGDVESVAKLAVKIVAVFQKRQRRVSWSDVVPVDLDHEQVQRHAVTNDWTHSKHSR